ncbi:hypothetical protein WG66_017031 [Moniliophthora roreri]|nr:hypothetical protein WG66_017031 [Moniliophthora roreri]
MAFSNRILQKVRTFNDGHVGACNSECLYFASHSIPIPPTLDCEVHVVIDAIIGEIPMRLHVIVVGVPHKKEEAVDPSTCMPPVSGK